MLERMSFLVSEKATGMKMMMLMKVTFISVTEYFLCARYRPQNFICLLFLNLNNQYPNFTNDPG